jgi:hypothetical protein
METMVSPIQTGLIATTGLVTTPNMTYIWNATPTAPSPNAPNQTPAPLTVSVSFGTGTSTGNTASAPIPWNSTQSVPISSNSTPELAGNLTAAWGDLDAATGNYLSYVVTFSGQMVYGNVNNVSSVDQSQTANDQQIIVCAYLTGDTSGS